MNRQKWLKKVNALLAVSLLVQVTTGYLQDDVGGLGLVHKSNAVLFLSLALSHAGLNWPWIKSTYLAAGKPS